MGSKKPSDAAGHLKRWLLVTVTGETGKVLLEKVRRFRLWELPLAL